MTYRHRSNSFSSLRTLAPVLVLAPLLALTPLTGCGDDEDSTVMPTSSSTSSTGGTGGTGGNGGGGQGGGVDENVYAFDSRFVEGESAVSYSGQSFRHVLIASLNNYVAGMTAQIDSDMFNPTDTNTVMLALNYYYDFDDSTSIDDPHGVMTMPAALQTSYADISSDKNLTGKMAGNDTSTDHKDWSTAFTGWADASIASGGGSITSPEGLLNAFFGTLAQLAVDRENGMIPNEPGTTTPIAEVYVTADGRDLKQLIQKFLLMGVAYSQGTDDYLHDDVADKGLLASNAQDGDKSYSPLGHAWDEGFGYFGAARNYALYTDDELASSGGRPDWQGMHDTNGDMAIDLLSEINWGASVNAAKRDRGATDATDFTADAFTAFHSGRQLILGAGETLTTEEQDQLRGYAEAAVAAWENAIAATVVHYINDTIADTQNIGTMDYNFLDHAKHWSELKGFALGLQFNPRSKLTDAQFTQLHSLVGDAPVLATATAQEQADYITNLEMARGIMMTAYGFSQANVENW